MLAYPLYVQIQLKVIEESSESFYTIDTLAFKVPWFSIGGHIGLRIDYIKPYFDKGGLPHYNF